jgi:hypothetical protein
MTQPAMDVASAELDSPAALGGVFFGLSPGIIVGSQGHDGERCGERKGDGGGFLEAQHMIFLILFPGWIVPKSGT